MTPLRNLGTATTTGTTIVLSIDRTIVTSRIDTDAIREHLGRVERDAPCIAVRCVDERLPSV